MNTINKIFDRIEKLTQKEGQSEFVAAMIADLLLVEEVETKDVLNSFELVKIFLLKIINCIDELSNELISDNSILISVKHQKLLRTCYQLISSIGVSTCMIPGLGISLSKRCSSSRILPQLKFKDEQKYELLVECANFFNRSYKVPVLKKIIITLHLSDYLAMMIQLSFAPIKKPGVYNNFVMTEDMYNKLLKEREQFVVTYKELVETSFQPTIMKELLVLQNENPPIFANKIIAKELNNRLLASDGVLSLIRCLIESYNIDTGTEWKKIDMISRIVSVKHGNMSESAYLTNICSQLEKILTLNISQYLVPAMSCVMTLNEKYPNSELVKELLLKAFGTLSYSRLVSKSNLPGTIILAPKEVDNKLNILHACVCTKTSWDINLIAPNIYVLLLIGTKCTKSEDLKVKLNDTLLKCLEKLNKTDVFEFIKKLLFDGNTELLIEEYDVGIAIKTPINNTDKDEQQSKSDELLYFLDLFKMSTEIAFVKSVFESALDILIDISKRRKNINKDLLEFEEDPTLLHDIDAQFANVLQLLSEISTSPKTVTALKTDPLIVLNFIEYFLSKDNYEQDCECTSIAIILLNTLLSNITTDESLKKRFSNMAEVLKKLAEDENDCSHILYKETLSLITDGISEQPETPCNKAISDVFDNLLPIRAHGLIELKKLIDARDPETIAKKHYLLCLFQEQLKDTDSYIYLAAINGLASLCTHATEDVLHTLCNEFLHISSEGKDVETDAENKVAEIRLKIGDVIVKVTRQLGEMAVVHKTLLLNTMLSGCRDHDPLIRTSALSNLAEIALVLHYKMGHILSEVFLCIWSIIESDQAVECRRAAVMVITNLLKGLGKDTLVQLKENLLPIYRTLKKIYSENNEDSIVRLHAQLALEELNDIVKQFLSSEIKMEKNISLRLS